MHRSARTMVRKAQRDLQNTRDVRGARQRRADLLAGKIISGMLAEAVDHLAQGLLRLGRRQFLRELRSLREAAAGGIGGLLWGARGPARRRLRAILDEIAGGDRTLVKMGLAVSKEGPRFRRREYSKAVSDELRVLLDDANCGSGGAAIETYLAGLSAGTRIECMRPAAKQLVAVLGSDAVAGLLDDGGILMVDEVRFFIPFLNAPTRRHVVRNAMRAQRELGDETSCVALFMCAPWLDVAEAAEAFASFFNAFGPLDPGNNLHELIRPHGHIYWSVPLLKKLGGDEALVAAGREVLAAVLRAEQQAMAVRRQRAQRTQAQ